MVGRKRQAFPYLCEALIWIVAICAMYSLGNVVEYVLQHRSEIVATAWTVAGDLSLFGWAAAVAGNVVAIVCLRGCWESLDCSLGSLLASIWNRVLGPCYWSIASALRFAPELAALKLRGLSSRGLSAAEEVRFATLVTALRESVMNSHRPSDWLRLFHKNDTEFTQSVEHEERLAQAIMRGDPSADLCARMRVCSLSVYRTAVDAAFDRVQDQLEVHRDNYVRSKITLMVFIVVAAALRTCIVADAWRVVSAVFVGLFLAYEHYRGTVQYSGCFVHLHAPVSVAVQQP